MSLTIDLDQDVDFLFACRVLGYQCVLARIVAVDLVDDESGGRICDLDEASVVKVNVWLAPTDGRIGTTSDTDK